MTAIVRERLIKHRNGDVTCRTEAVTKYLDDPQSLEVSAEPATPVPFSQIAAAGMANPLDLTKSLGVTVSANEDE